MDKRRKWIAVLLEEGLRLGVVEPEDILRHATPNVLATDLPSNLVASVLQGGLLSSNFSPSLIVNTLGPENLAEHIPLPVLWTCIMEAAGAIIAEHPLSAGNKAQENTVLVEPGLVQTDEIPDIEVLEG